MNHSMINALVSMQSLQQKLDVLSNNIANVNTAGYKRRDASFQDILTNVSRQPSSFERAGRLTPLGLPQGWGAKIGQIELIMDQGVLKNTGNPFDLGLEGDGMFEVRTDSPDADGNPTTAWTRDGSFKLSVIPGNPGRLYLTTQEGYLVIGSDNRPVTVPVNSEITVREDGTVYARNASNPEAEPTREGKIKVVRAVRPQVLVNAGNNLFALPSGADASGVIEPADFSDASGEGRKTAVRQGFLEQSNVNLTEEMTELMALQRAYQMNARAIASSDTLMSLANNLRS